MVCILMVILQEMMIKDIILVILSGEILIERIMLMRIEIRYMINFILKNISHLQQKMVFHHIWI